MKKLFVTIVLLVLLSTLPVLAAACSSSTSTSSSSAPATISTSASANTTTSAAGQQKTLVIGASLFLTGPASTGGIAVQQGMQLAVDQCNQNGGIKIGNDTYNVKLDVMDDAMSSDQAVANATKLIEQDHATVIVGPLTPAMKEVVYPVCAQNGVLMADTDGLNCGLPYPNSPEVSPSKPLFISMAFTADEISPFLLDHLVKAYPNAKTVALCGVQEDDLGYLINDKGGVKDQLAARGLSSVGDIEQFAPDVSDFGPVVAKMLANKPDAIFMPISTPITFGLCVKAARSLGFMGPMFFGTHLDVNLQAKLTGDPTVSNIFGGSLTLADQAGLPQSVKDLENMYTQKYPAKDMISDVFVVGYNGLNVLLQTIQKAQSVDPATIVKTYEGLTTPGDLQTIYGPAYVGGQQTFGVNRVLCSPYILAQTMNGVSTNFETVNIKVP